MIKKDDERKITLKQALKRENKNCKSIEDLLMSSLKDKSKEETKTTLNRLKTNKKLVHFIKWLDENQESRNQIHSKYNLHRDTTCALNIIEKEIKSENDGNYPF